MPTKEALDVIEETLEVLDEAPENVRTRVILGGALVLGGVALLAGAAGWLLCEKRLKARYEAILDEEVAEAKAYYQRLNKRDNSPEETVRALHPEAEIERAGELLQDYRSDAVEPEEPEVTVETENVFERAVTDIEISAEDLANRSRDVPYVIGHEEFMEGDYQQVQLTWYEGDATLADEKAEPILEIGKTVGEDNFKFGYGSGDPKTVFVRNDRLEMDFEISQSDGKFSEEVLGFHHSDDNSRGRDRHERRSHQPRFRGGDE